MFTLDDFKTLQTEAQNHELVELSRNECILRFSQTMINDISAVVVVAKDGPFHKNYSLISPINYYTPIEYQEDPPRKDPRNLSSPPLPPYAWICDSRQVCDPKTLTSQSSWQLSVSRSNYTIDHCLARPDHQRCNVELSIYFMMTVIICNMIKLLCFCVCYLIKDYEPLVIVGDAICSFMLSPDDYSGGLGPVSSRAVREGAWKLHQEARMVTETYLPGEFHSPDAQIWRNQRPRYFSVVGSRRWVCTAAVLGAIFFAGLGLLLTTHRGVSAKEYTTDFTFNTNRVFPGTYSLLAAVVSANTFQLAISSAYMLYNGTHHHACLFFLKQGLC